MVGEKKNWKRPNAEMRFGYVIHKLTRACVDGAIKFSQVGPLNIGGRPCVEVTIDSENDRVLCTNLQPGDRELLIEACEACGFPWKYDHEPAAAPRSELRQMAKMVGYGSAAQTATGETIHLDDCPTCEGHGRLRTESTFDGPKCTRCGGLGKLFPVRGGFKRMPPGASHTSKAFAGGVPAGEVVARDMDKLIMEGGAIESAKRDGVGLGSTLHQRCEADNHEWYLLGGKDPICRRCGAVKKGDQIVHPPDGYAASGFLDAELSGGVIRKIERCPTCDSPKPNLHPAMQHEGEVQPCSDPFHAEKPGTEPARPTTDEENGVGAAPHDGKVTK